jgi:hypothetical protein
MSKFETLSSVNRLLVVTPGTGPKYAPHFRDTASPVRELLLVLQLKWLLEKNHEFVTKISVAGTTQP